MLLETFSKFDDFELLDSGAGYRLERWAEVILARPDPQAIWEHHLDKSEWDKANAVFDDHKREWVIKTDLPKSWIIKYNIPDDPTSNLSRPDKSGHSLHALEREMRLFARLAPFKHTGIFAEQASNWAWISKKLEASTSKLKALNLFGYTGAATIWLTKLGCMVTHVDASKPALAWAKENQKLNDLPDDSIRWILDDVGKFVKRELKRGQKYDAIIMDPPAFGHSPTGKTWKFNDDLPALLSDCEKLLSDDARFLIVNGYATNSSAIALQNLLEDVMVHRKGHIESGELGLKQKDGRLLSTGIFARWSPIK